MVVIYSFSIFEDRRIPIVWCGNLDQITFGKPSPLSLTLMMSRAEVNQHHYFHPIQAFSWFEVFDIFFNPHPSHSKQTLNPFLLQKNSLIFFSPILSLSSQPAALNCLIPGPRREGWENGRSRRCNDEFAQQAPSRLATLKMMPRENNYNYSNHQKDTTVDHHYFRFGLYCSLIFRDYYIQDILKPSILKPYETLVSMVDGESAARKAGEVQSQHATQWRTNDSLLVSCGAMTPRAPMTFIFCGCLNHPFQTWWENLQSLHLSWEKSWFPVGFL